MFLGVLRTPQMTDLDGSVEHKTNVYLGFTAHKVRQIECNNKQTKMLTSYLELQTEKVLSNLGQT